MSAKIVSINPETIELNLPSSNSDSESDSCFNLSLENLSDSFVIYKAFINKKSLILVKPSFSFIPPLQTISLSIKPLETDPSLYQADPLKLLLIFLPSPSTINSIEQAKQIFQQKKEDQNQRQESIIDIKINSIFDNNNNERKSIKKQKVVKERDIYFYIEKYTKMKNKLSIEEGKIQKNIEDKNKELLDKKKKFLKEIENAELPKDKNKNKKRVKPYNKMFDFIIIMIIVLIGLVIGANLANGVNKLFKRKNNQNLNEITDFENRNEIKKEKEKENLNIVEKEKDKKLNNKGDVKLEIKDDNDYDNDD